MAVLAVATLTMAILTMAVLSVAVLTMAILTMAWHRVAREWEQAAQKTPLRGYRPHHAAPPPLAWPHTRGMATRPITRPPFPPHPPLQARDSEREKARLETELEQETERAFNLGSTSFTDSRSRGSSYPPSPALSSTSTPALISPRLVLTLPYSPARDHSRRDSSRPRLTCNVHAWHVPGPPY